MNVTKLWIVADSSAGNIREGEVVAYRRAGDAEWRDPHGGFFNEREQEYLNELALGRSDTVRLDGVRSERVFKAHLAANF